MKELLELKSMLDNINPENDNIPLELLDELNETLQYALGWCKGWLTQRALTAESLAQSQAVSNTETLSQSDSDTPPAQAQVS